jgi:hypothetical protein
VCNAISGDYWIMSREIAAGNVQDFCNQHEKTKIYNTGSDNELELSVKKAGEDNLGPQDSPDCVGRFIGVMLDGYDGRDAVNNPWNYKFGSTLTTGDEWELTMTHSASKSTTLTVMCRIRALSTVSRSVERTFRGTSLVPTVKVFATKWLGATVLHNGSSNGLRTTVVSNGTPPAICQSARKLASAAH